MVGVGVHVEQALAGGVAQCVDDGLVAALAHVDDAFEHAPSWTTGDQASYPCPDVGGTVDVMGGTEWLIVAVVVLVLFGGSQLPKLARSLGEAQKEFKKGIEPEGKNGTGKPDPSKTDES